MIIEAFLIVSVASLNLAVVPWRSRTKDVIVYAVTIAKNVHGMDSSRLCGMRKFSTAVCLNFLRCISKPCNRPLYEVNSRKARMFFIGVDKPLSRGLFKDCILIILFL